MALKDLLRRKSPVEKASKDLREAFAQPDVRRAAWATLLDIGTEEAYDELLRRFTFNANGNIADESEKRDLTADIVHVGEEMIGALKRYIAKEKALIFPIRAMSQLLSREDCLAFLIETLGHKEPLDHRSTEAKRALIIAIGDTGGPEHAAALVPYLEDHHDDVQTQAIEAIERLSTPETIEALAEVCCRDTHSGRVQTRAALALINLEYSAKKTYARFQPEVKSEFVLGKKGQLVRKSGASKSS